MGIAARGRMVGRPAAISAVSRPRLPGHAPRRVRSAAAAVAALALASVTVAVVRRDTAATDRPLTSPAAPVATPTTAVPATSTTASPALTPAVPLVSALGAIWARTPGGCLTVTTTEGTVFEANPRQQVAPASVIKLITAVAALRVLGDETRFRTVVRSTAPPANGVVNGDVWLVGGGDPVLGTDAWAAEDPKERAVHTSLDALADRLVAAGVRRIEGRVVGDESRYDATRYVASWPPRLIADGEAGPLSALAVNDGFRVWGHPGVAFTDPPHDAAALFAELLAARGIAVLGAGSGRATGTVELAGIDSVPVGDLVTAMLRYSDNESADLLVKEMGLRRYGAGTTATGVRVVTELLSTLGLRTSDAVIADGSGLSDADRVTCGLLTSVLSAEASLLRERLPVAGRDGTLANVLVGTPAAGRVRAKTGSLDYIAGFAGYVDATSGERLTFSYVINGLPKGSSGRALRDAVATALVTRPV